MPLAPRQVSDGSANFNTLGNHVHSTCAVEYGVKEVFRPSIWMQTTKFLDRERTKNAVGWFGSHDVKLRRTNTPLMATDDCCQSRKRSLSARRVGVARFRNTKKKHLHSHIRAVDGISIAVRHEDLDRCVYTGTGQKIVAGRNDRYLLSHTRSSFGISRSRPKKRHLRRAASTCDCRRVDVDVAGQLSPTSHPRRFVTDTPRVPIHGTRGADCDVFRTLARLNIITVVAVRRQRCHSHRPLNLTGLARCDATGHIRIVPLRYEGR
jgi:hypothetical protein